MVVYCFNQHHNYPRTVILPHSAMCVCRTWRTLMTDITCR